LIKCLIKQGMNARLHEYLGQFEHSRSDWIKSFPSIARKLSSP
jgi:hypothetical protein